MNQQLSTDIIHSIHSSQEHNQNPTSDGHPVVNAKTEQFHNIQAHQNSGQQISEQKIIGQSKTLEIEATQQELQQYDKMMYEWRHIQRKSLSKNMNHYDFSKKPKASEKDQILSKYNTEIHNYLRAKFIYEELINPIQTQKLLDLNNIKNLEYLYLICFRAWCEINHAKQSFKAYPQSAPVGSHPIENDTSKDKMSFAYVTQPILKLSTRVEQTFETYHKALAFKEKSFLNRLKNLTNYIFHFKAKSERDRFICGFEGTDFMAKQQIQYTATYSELILKNLKKAGTVGDKIAKYRQIVSIDLPKLEGFDCFDIMKNTILNQWKASKGLQ